MKTIKHHLTRGEAIDAGLLVDLTSDASAFGIPYPFAITAPLYRQAIARPPDALRSEGEALTDLLWGFMEVMEQTWIVNSFFCCIPWFDAKDNETCLRLHVYVERNGQERLITLAAPGENNVREVVLPYPKELPSIESCIPRLPKRETSEAPF